MSEQLHPEVAILSAALELPAGQRGAYLDKACAGDAELRLQVEALLQADRQAEGFLESLPPALAFCRTEVANIPLTEKPGDKIGRYKLLQQIGEGGCGVVYMAEQEEPVRRRVALKVIKLGMDTKEFVARFEAERQALALMDHANIAKVFDAGATDTGRPYFVMELVRGIKITEFCDENKLSTKERLKLLIQVCLAIQHAHQKGVIHRDIKPSNVLVTINDGVPVPKVIDFGIAKATAGRLTDQTLFTAFEQFLGTPAYMSPEQAVMTSLDIDTRSDIYSLGVLLYQLLTGRTPFDGNELLKAGFDEMRRTIREVEPVKPSTRLTQERLAERSTGSGKSEIRNPKPDIDKDLDWIVMKCLEKDRSRRYETATGLAADLQHHLNHEPIVARPTSRAERLWRWCRRKPALAGLYSAVPLLLVSIAVVSTVSAVRVGTARKKVEAEKKLAQAQAARSDQVSRFLQDMLKGIRPGVALGRDTQLLREILDQTVERIALDLTNQPAVEAELRRTIGNTYSALGQYAKAEAMLRQAHTLRRNLAGPLDWDAAVALNDLGSVAAARGDHSTAEALYREALATFRRTNTNEHEDVATALSGLGGVLIKRGDVPAAETLHKEALAIQRRVHGSNHVSVVESLRHLAWVAMRRYDLAGAESLAREALALSRALFSNQHPQIARSLDELAFVLATRGNGAEAIRLSRESLSIQRGILGSQSPLLAGSLFTLGDRLRAAGRWAEAESVLREALERGRGSENLALLGNVLHHLADVLRHRQALEEARRLAQEALAVYWEHPGLPVDECDHATEVLLKILDDLKDDPAIEALRRKAEDYVRNQFVRDLTNREDRLSRLAESLRHIPSQYAAAEALYRELIESRHSHGLPGDRKVLDDQQSLADVLYVRAWHQRTNAWSAFSPADPASRSPPQQAREAQQLMRECLELFSKVPGIEPWRLPSIKSGLGFSLLVEAATDRGLGAPARQAKFVEGEAMLFEAIDTILGTNDPAAKTIEYLRTAAERLSIMYEQWEIYPAPPPAAPATKSDAARSASDTRAADNKRLLDEILASARREHTNDPAGLTSHLENGAKQLASRGNLIVAEALYREVVAMHTNASCWPLVRSFSALMTLLESRGALDEAETVARRAVVVVTDRFGEDHTAVAVALRNLSVFLSDRDHLAEAEAPARRALAIATKHEGEASRQAADSRDQLATVTWNLGDRDGAEQLYRLGLDLVRRWPGTEPTLLEKRLAGLTDLLIDRHKFTEAEPFARELIQLRSARLPAEDEDVVAPAVTLGGILAEIVWSERLRFDAGEPAARLEAERAREAERLLRECLARRLQTLPERSTRLAETRSRLGAALLAVAVTDESLEAPSREAKLAEAEVLMRKGFESLRQINYAKASSRRKALSRLIRLCEARDMVREANVAKGASPLPPDRQNPF